MTSSRLSLIHQVRWPSTQPAGAAPRPAHHPTLVALHGRGSDEADLLGLVPFLDERLLWVSPRAPLDLEDGYEWYRVPAFGQPDPESFEGALAALDRFIDEALAAYPIEPQQLYLFGFSQGSMLAQAYALQHPDRIAGVMAHSGYLPIDVLPASSSLETNGVRGKPFAIVHGTQDRTIPVELARAARDYLAGLGADVTYYEFPIGHNVGQASLAVLDEWLRARLDEPKS